MLTLERVEGDDLLGIRGVHHVDAVLTHELLGNLSRSGGAKAGTFHANPESNLSLAQQECHHISCDDF